MNNNILILWSINVITKLILVFVSILFIYKIYMKFRSRFNISVNCWFCNQNTIVPYSAKNCWTCAQCEQYNGFTKDGAYNREMIEQYEGNCKIGQRKYSPGMELSSLMNSETYSMYCNVPGSNGFCEGCNESQRLKVEKLAQFEPRKESRFDEEIKSYKAQLEDQYRLCASCDRHLKKVLHEKKRMVLGSKFLHFILKGAQGIKLQAQHKTIDFAKKHQWKRRFYILITIATLINLWCLSGCVSSVVTKEKLIRFFGGPIGKQLFLILSHFVAIWRVLINCFESFGQHALIIKIQLFLNTIFMMLLYSLGLSLPQITRLNFQSVYTLVAPLIILFGIFGYNLVDRFRISRYTFLLVVWSLYAGSVMEPQIFEGQDFVMFLTSLLTLFLTIRNKIEIPSKLHDGTDNSFHKLFSEDYLSDEDTISYLSERLSSNDNSLNSTMSDHNSMRDYDANQSFCGVSSSYKSGGKVKRNNISLKRSPLTSSMLSLNLASSNRAENWMTSRPNTFMQRNLSSPFNSRTTSTYDDYLNKSKNGLFGNPTLNNIRAEQPRANSVFSNCNSSKFNYLNDPFVSNNPFNHNGNCAETPFDNTPSFFNRSVCTAIPRQQHPADSMFLNRFDHNSRNNYDNCDNHLYGNGINTFSTNNQNTNASPSPLFVSNDSLKNLGRPSGVLSPSRFSISSFNKFPAIPASNDISWVSAAYSTRTACDRNSDFNICNINKPFTKNNDSNDGDLSRASSRSSGFESQESGRLNHSRDSSNNRELENEPSNLLQRTLTLDDCGQSTCKQDCGPTYASAKQLPLSVSCNSSFDVCNSSETLSPFNNPGSATISAFNNTQNYAFQANTTRCRIQNNKNTLLSTIKPGDLLKKWKDGQGVSTNS